MDFALSAFAFSFVSVLAALPAGWLLGKFVQKIRVSGQRRSWQHHSTIYAEYASPDNLHPGEVAYLYDRVFGQAELLATIFDLELRKKVRLDQSPSKAGEVDFEIKVPGPSVDPDLSHFEQEVLITIKSYGAKSLWSQLKYDTAIWDSSIEQTLEAGLTQKGYLQPETSSFVKIIKYLLIGAVIAGLTVVLPLYLTEAPSQPFAGDTYASLRRDMAVFQVSAFWLLASAAYGIAVYYGVATYYRALDMRKGTAKLRRLWPHLAGYREYLRVVEQDRIQYENQTLHLAARAHALPYATALDLSTRWQQRFKL